MAEAAGLAAGHAHAVVDALVRVLVEKCDVAGSEERRDGRDVRVVAGGERGGGLVAEEVRERVLELVVQLVRAGEQADAAGGRAEPLDRRLDGGLDARVADQAEVAVRREEDEGHVEDARLGARRDGERQLVRVQRVRQAGTEQLEPAADGRGVEERARGQDLVDRTALEETVERVAGERRELTLDAGCRFRDRARTRRRAGHLLLVPRLLHMRPHALILFVESRGSARQAAGRNATLTERCPRLSSAAVNARRYSSSAKTCVTMPSRSAAPAASSSSATS